MRRLPPVTDLNVLVGYGTADDAGVYKVRDDLALVQTVDFFTPIVDDPFDFGRIAAANALSDVYAMGAMPLTALNIAAFPFDELGADVLERILAGGAHVTREAGVAVLGGHTIKDAEPKYGLCVTGTVHPDRLVTNADARPGDVLVLTKPLGTGVLATALKRARIDDGGMQQATDWMTLLNDRACRAMQQAGAHAATDITGFGLLGHAFEMAFASNVALEIDSARVPIMDGVLELIAEGVIPGGSEGNVKTHAGFTEFAGDVSPEMRVALSDAQTSGGLLIALDSARLLEFERGMDGAFYVLIGSVHEGKGLRVT